MPDGTPILFKRGDNGNAIPYSTPIDEKMRQEEERNKLRYVLEHTPHIHPATIDRFVHLLSSELRQNPERLRLALLSYFGPDAGQHAFRMYSDGNAQIVSPNHWRAPAMSEAMRELQAKKESIDINKVHLHSGIYDKFTSVEDYHIDEDNADSWFISRPGSVDSALSIKSIKESTEKIEAEGAMIHARNQLNDERRRERQEAWTKRDIRNKVSAYGMIEPFKGIMDLDNVQLAKLREILSSVEDVDLLKKNKRASDLVKKWITSEEWNELLTEHKVTIQSKLDKRRTFVVYEDPMRKVDVYEKSIIADEKPIREVNKLKHTICGVTADYGYADGDQILNKIIAIKEDEHRYIKTSNIYNE
jgi:hypothetical protein